MSSYKDLNLERANFGKVEAWESPNRAGIVLSEASVQSRWVERELKRGPRARGPREPYGVPDASEANHAMG